MENHCGEDHRHLPVQRKGEARILTKLFPRWRRCLHRALGPCLHPPRNATTQQQRKALPTRYPTRPPERLLAQLLVARDQSLIARRTARRWR